MNGLRDYPLPSHAAAIWSNGDSIFIAFPGVGTEKGHTVSLPNTVGGLKQALSILEARRHNSAPRVGTKAAPTQYEIERALVNDKKLAHWQSMLQAERRETEAAKAQAVDMLKELGL